MNNILTERDRLRGLARAKRQSLSPSYRARSASMLAKRFIKNIELAPQSIIAGYHPRGGELNVVPLLKELAALGHQIALPVVTKLNQPLIFRQWDFDAPLDKDLLNMTVPPDTAAEVRPNLIIVPAVAFTIIGDRLGTGGGYYDRTLAALRKEFPALLAVGVGYDIQLYKFIPTQPHDARMDWVVTDKAAHYCP